ncbi:MAG TPA: NlpC/P60 family protein [Stellaceae bacterium]|nr:NlpC/P60 family protein [Stellaceae bacterium]
MMTLDKRLNAYRADLADARLCQSVVAARYAEGRSARVVAGCAAVRPSPDPQAEVSTFYHYGESLLVFDEAGGYAWCQSLFDCYVGYVDARHIAIGPAPAPSHFVATLGSYAYEAPDLRSAARDFLPRHSGVVVAESGLVTRGTEYARLDTGGYLPRATLSPHPPRSPDVVAAAALYLGCPYLWGGRSWLGIDCSGLVQSAFRDVGRTVVRDTDMQQGTIGNPGPVRGQAGLRRGDLLYLPGHALIYGGDGTVIHADGASMTVRRDHLAGLMRRRGLDFAGFAVRRHPSAAA